MFLCWVCPGSEDNLGHCSLLRLSLSSIVSGGCLQPWLIFVTGAGKKKQRQKKTTGLRLTSTTGRIAERYRGRRKLCFLTASPFEDTGCRLERKLLELWKTYCDSQSPGHQGRYYQRSSNCLFTVCRGVLEIGFSTTWQVSWKVWTQRTTWR